ncbi:MAG TPA: hypothetical protein VK668_01335 [Mucilaginibacter sp.]|nr:hypothetical protein [Mucilaginibacter sp.]
MREEEESRKVRKTGSPKVRKKPEVSSRKSERTPVADSLAPSEINELQTENHPLQTEQMEVHHHPQLEHKPKPWKEYLLEGLMIFVAVVMGFIAENVRESITEHKRAAEFAQSYYTDIKKDTFQINKAIRLTNHKMAAIDSAVTILHQPPSSQGDTILAYKSIAASVVMPFEPSSGNLESIKTSGAVRNFKQKMISLMNEYDLQARGVIRRDDITQKFNTEQFIPYGLSHFSYEISYDIMTSGKIAHELLFLRDPKERKVFINILMVDKILILRSMQEYKKLLTVADKVLTELKKQYDLEDE